MAAGERRMLLKMRLKAFGRKAGSDIGSCIDILINDDVRADRYVGMSIALAFTSGGELMRESIMVGRFVNTAGLADPSFGGGVSKCARRE